MESNKTKYTFGLDILANAAVKSLVKKQKLIVFGICAEALIILYASHCFKLEIMFFRTRT
jgi:hypothetical protein